MLLIIRLHVGVCLRFYCCVRLLEMTGMSGSFPFHRLTWVQPVKACLLTDFRTASACLQNGGFLLINTFWGKAAACFKKERRKKYSQELSSGWWFLYRRCLLFSQGWGGLSNLFCCMPVALVSTSTRCKCCSIGSTEHAACTEVTLTARMWDHQTKTGSQLQFLQSSFLGGIIHVW